VLTHVPDLQIRGKISAAVDAISWVFWLAAAAVATSLLTDQFTDNSRTRASCAFSWVTWWAAQQCMQPEAVLAACASVAGAVALLTCAWRPAPASFLCWLQGVLDDVLDHQRA
jgi:hypothetical protein